MIIDQPQQNEKNVIVQNDINLQVDENPKKLEAKPEKKENIHENPQERRVLHYLNTFRNKDSIDYLKMNKQINKIKRKEDKFLSDRECEQFESQYNDFGFGEMVMSFPNPDYIHEDHKPMGITFKEAMAIFDDNLNVINPQITAHEIEFQRKAFQLSFLLLDDYVPNTEEAQDEEKQKKEQEEKKRKLKEKQQAEQKKILEAQRKENEKANLIPKGGKIKSGDGKYLELKRQRKGLSDAEINELIADIKYIEEQKEIPLLGNLQQGQSADTANKANVAKDADKDKKDKKDNKEQAQLVTQGQAQPVLTTQPNEQAALKDGTMRGEKDPHHFYGSITFLLNQLIDGTMNNDLSSFKNVKKKVNKGKFMYIRYYEKDDFDWIITNHVPRDFQTLFRMACITKLTVNGKLQTRSILNGEGNEIIVSVKAAEDIVRQTASYYKHNKQIELGYADILSLEPCDDKFRPLRLKYLVRLAVKNVKKSRDTELGDKTKQQKVSGVLPVRNLREYLSMEEDVFWVDLGKKQLYFDGMLKEITQEIKTNQDQELVEIIDDNDPLNNKLWAAYSLYLDYMIYYCSKMRALKKLAKEKAKEKAEQENEKRKQDGAKTGKNENQKIVLNPYEKNNAFLFRLIFKQAIEDSNLYFEKIQSFFKAKQSLKNIWHILEVENPIPPFNSFSNSPYEEHLLFWRKYEVNEFKQRSIFTNMEKIKVCDIIVGDNINVLKMLSQGLMLNYFPLHDVHQLKGDYKMTYFQKVIENEIIPEPELSEVEERIRKMFLMLDSQADPSDFDTSSVIKDLQIRILRPWYLQIDTIRDYYGEKIAIYFKFLSSYTFHLSYMSLIGVIIEIIIAALKNNNHNETAAGFRFFFAVVIVVWQCAFIEFWKREQALFSLTYGQEDYQATEQERPSFVGSYRRSVANDKINEQYYSEMKRKTFIFISLVMSFLVICLVIGIIFALFFFKAWMLENNILLNAPFINPNTLIGILNSIQIIIFNQIYLYMNNWMSEKENHQILQSYENSYISKVFMFTFCNTFNSCFIIAFFNDLIKIEKNNTTYINFCKSDDKNGQEDCFEVLRTQMISIFLINLIKNIPELVVPMAKTFAKKALRGKHDSLIMHPFRQIDTYIKNQFDLEPYTTNREIDGTVSDYMELIIQFAFLILFGVAFPTSFLLAFVNNILEIQVDKAKLIYISRRPIPTGAADIGTWFLILEIVSFISVFTNAGLIAFTSDTVDTNSHYAADPAKYSQRIFFITFLVFIFLKYLVSSLIDDVPTQVGIIKKRHKNCINSLLKGLSKTKARSMVTTQPNQMIELVQYPQVQSKPRTQISLYEKVGQHNENLLNPIKKEKQKALENKSLQNKSGVGATLLQTQDKSDNIFTNNVQDVRL